MWSLKHCNHPFYAPTFNIYKVITHSKKDILPSLKTVIRSKVLLKYYLPKNIGDGSVARMSSADRLRSGLGLPMSDRLMITWPVGRRAPITSPHRSLAHPCQWIRRHMRRYTLQGVPFTNLNSVHMKEFAPPASQTPRVLHSILRHSYESDRLQKNPPHGVSAPPRAPPSVRTSTPDARRKQAHVPSGRVVCRQHTLTTSTPHSTHIHILHTSYIANYPSTTMSLPSNLPDSYKQVLLMDRPTVLFADDHLSPRSRLVDHPLAPFLTAPQIPNADHGLGSPLEPTPGTALQTPLVLTAPSSAPDLGRANDLSARVIDSYLLTSQYSTAPPYLASFWLHGVFLPNTPDSSCIVLSARSLARR
jgi:hypothetical protein